MSADTHVRPSPRMVAAMIGAEEIRCTECGRLLAKARGSASVEIKCPKCGNTATHEVKQ